jgi:hypothetical protein
VNGRRQSLFFKETIYLILIVQPVPFFSRSPNEVTTKWKKKPRKTDLLMNVDRAIVRKNPSQQQAGQTLLPQGSKPPQASQDPQANIPEKHS